jgi:hypothetical protein
MIPPGKKQQKQPKTVFAGELSLMTYVPHGAAGPSM